MGGGYSPVNSLHHSAIRRNKTQKECAQFPRRKTGGRGGTLCRPIRKCLGVTWPLQWNTMGSRGEKNQIEWKNSLPKYYILCNFHYLLRASKNEAAGGSDPLSDQHYTHEILPAWWTSSPADELLQRNVGTAPISCPPYSLERSWHRGGVDLDSKGTTPALDVTQTDWKIPRGKKEKLAAKNYIKWGS